jgi:branched-chain amino acid transport system substrate-binding protein
MKRLGAALAPLLLAAAAQADDKPPIPIVAVLELSGGAATPGNNFNNGAKLAVKEINAAGGILGRKIELTSLDTQSNPSIAKALTQKAVDMNAYVVVGPTASGSVIVSMLETKRAEIPNFVGAEAANITLQGNPYIFRTSFGQTVSMPKLSRYIKDELRAKTVGIVWVNNDFGKGGRDELSKDLAAGGVKVVADLSTDPLQLDFTAVVLKVKQANPDVAFVYLNEEESARILKEFRKQGYDKPIVGETTIVGQKVIQLAGDAANGAKGHVGLTADAPFATFKAFDEKFTKEYGYRADHNGMKGYFSIEVVKTATEKMGKVDSKALAKSLKNGTLCVKDNPGLLLDVRFDDRGDIDRESFLVEVKAGKQEIIKVVPPLRGSFESACGKK